MAWRTLSGRLHLASRFNLDTLIGAVLFFGGLYAYTATLAPTVLEGDAALFQYTPYVLGVTYPTGYPLYILLGRLWLAVFPFGEIAWRMNLFSALCSSAALPLIYAAARHLLAGPNRPAGHTPRLAALAAVLTFATLPTVWRWSTEAKIYALNLLLFSGVLYTLARAATVQTPRPDAPRSRAIWPAALLLGLQISVHSTTVLLIPGLALFVWLNAFRERFNRRLWLVYAGLVVLPGLLYLYVPLRAEWLIAAYGRPEAIARGLLADFYHSGWAGWVRYFTAADFTGGVVTNWGLVPRQLVTVYLPELLVDNVTLVGAWLGLAGGLALAVMRPRRFWPLFLVYAVPIPFVLTYGQGEQAAFLIPSFLIFSFFVGNTLILAGRLLENRPGNRLYAPLLGLVVVLLLAVQIIPRARYNINRLDAKWSRAIFDEWADALAHPLEPGAAMLAHWGDLTSFWYMQHAEGRRPDLRGVYPPTEEVVAGYLARGGNLYIAGPLQGWAGGIQERYRLIPWGRLVRIAPRQVDPQTLLPPLPNRHQAIFNQSLRLLASDFPARAAGGFEYPVTLTWQALAGLPPETTVSLRFSRENSIVAQLDDTLLSGWFPQDTLPPGQVVLSYMPVPVPAGTLPGRYRLQLVTYTSHRRPWPLSNGATLLDLGEVEVVSPPAGFWPDSTGYVTLPGYHFGGEIELVHYRYTVARVGQGKGFGVEMLWRAKQAPRDNYTLRVELVDIQGRVIRTVDHPPAGGAAPTGSWHAGQFVRDQVDLVVPAGAAVGPEAVRVRLSWLRPDGSQLAVRRWGLPSGNHLALDWLEVTEKEGRVFEVPAVQQSVNINLGGKVRFIGFNSLPQPEPDAGQRARLRLSRDGCAVAAGECRLHFDLYWQGVSEMDAPYFVFLHVVNEQGQIVAQHDRTPGRRGKQPTTGWLPGEVVADPVDIVLPPDLPPGRYTLWVGMYLPPDGPRLPILDESGQAGADFIDLAVLEVNP